MLIYEFLGHDEAHDYESLGIPAVPKELTRVTAKRYRLVLEAYLRTLAPEKDAKVATLRRSTRMREAGRIKRRHRWYHDHPTFVSATKMKRQRERSASDRGKPFHQRDDNMGFAAAMQVRECRDTARALVEEVLKRYPNLAPAPFERQNQRAIPTVADYIDDL